MSHGAKPVTAALFGIAALLTAGVASACPSHTTHSAQAPASDSVADQGKGGHKAGEGFGSMMIRSLVDQLGGQLDYRDRKPGLEVVLKARIDPAV